jgi:hypothetical protein
MSDNQSAADIYPADAVVENWHWEKRPTPTVTTAVQWRYVRRIRFGETTFIQDAAL